VTLFARYGRAASAGSSPCDVCHPLRRSTEPIRKSLYTSALAADRSRSLRSRITRIDSHAVNPRHRTGIETKTLPSDRVFNDEAAGLVLGANERAQHVHDRRVGADKIRVIRCACTNC